MNQGLPATVKHCGKTYTVQKGEQVRGNRYLLLRKLSQRERTRWLAIPARNGALDTLCVLNVLPRPGLTTERFRILQKLAAANRYVPRILDYEFRRDEALVVTDWVIGQTLRTYLQRMKMSHRPISPHQAVRLYKGLVQTLTGFHRDTGLVHGDVTPENLVIGSRGASFSLIDFGSAWRMVKAVHRETGDGQRASYAAPEVLTGKPACELSDQFSATAVFFELLTGEIPYTRLGGAVIDVPERERDSMWVRPSELAPVGEPIPKRLWKRIDEVGRRGLSLDANQRFANRHDWLNAAVSLFRDMDVRPEHATQQGWMGRLVNRLFPESD